MTRQPPPHLEPSELGTKDFWDATYATDLKTHVSTPSHIGQIWFADVNASQKTLRYLTSSSLSLSREGTSFLDLGTGNGEMLFLLREEGKFAGELVGVDYSEASIDLCRQLAVLKGYPLEPGSDGTSLDFVTWDIMRTPARQEWVEGFDVVLDKGTFDAVSLSEEIDEQGRRICEGYRERVERLVKKGGYVLVTSCNWTEEELEDWFTSGDLDVFGRVQYPTFKFGGQTGQSVCSVCFKKKS